MIRISASHRFIHALSKQRWLIIPIAFCSLKIDAAFWITPADLERVLVGYCYPTILGRLALRTTARLRVCRRFAGGKRDRTPGTSRAMGGRGIYFGAWNFCHYRFLRVLFYQIRSKAKYSTLAFCNNWDYAFTAILLLGQQPVLKPK